MPNNYDKAKSWCYCGHLGDGLLSQHAGINGHGPCVANGCDCNQFTWKGFTKDFQTYLDERSANE